jgi:hypothetical protein
VLRAEFLKALRRGGAVNRCLDRCRPAWNEPAVKKRQARMLVSGNCRIRIGSLERSSDSSFDRTLYAPERLIVSERRSPAPAIFDKQALQREGQQRQRVPSPARFGRLFRR